MRSFALPRLDLGGVGDAGKGGRSGGGLQGFRALQAPAKVNTALGAGGAIISIIA